MKQASPHNASLQMNCENYLKKAVAKEVTGNRWLDGNRNGLRWVGQNREAKTDY